MREATERETRLLDAAVVTGGLGPKHSQPHREYHNLMHVEDVLLRIEELQPPSEHELALALAAWFHDAVYQPGQDDNEDRSAYVAYDALEQVGADPELIHEVVRLVRLTASHEPDDDDVAGAVLCDADLAILAAKPERYAHYATAIRQEYVHVPEAEFRAGRVKVLRRFLQRPSIYRTAHAREHWEAKARANMSDEIEALES
ncbi:MAG: metal-dependent phosphohydrolase [Actinomycetia bacterium]|nr:metal-dependent phosphohydrolase [Actinomycetes bacterium]